MKSQLDRVLKLLNLDDINISINNTRCTFPTAYYYPATKKIIIHANKPSLVRLALAYLIIHEKAHDTYTEIMEGDEMERPPCRSYLQKIITEYERRLMK
jgi:hypothetical protein